MALVDGVPRSLTGLLILNNKKSRSDNNTAGQNQKDAQVFVSELVLYICRHTLAIFNTII